MRTALARQDHEQLHPLASATPLSLSYTPCPQFYPFAYQDHEQIRDYGLLQGFDSVVWTVVLLNSCGGLLVAAVMKCAVVSMSHSTYRSAGGGRDAVRRHRRQGSPWLSTYGTLPSTLPTTRVRLYLHLLGTPTTLSSASPRRWPS